MDRDRMNRQGQAAGAMNRPRLALAAALVVLSCGLAAFLVLGSTANTQDVSASSAAEVSQVEPITGTLSKPGYTVIALAADGIAKTDLSAADGSFSVSPPAKKVSLHLRAPDGTYAGPIVLEEGWNVVKRAKKKLRQARKDLKRAKKKLKKAESKAAKRKAKKKVKQASKKLRQANMALRQARTRASGRRAILRLQAGAKLGNVTARPAAGYAKARLNERQWNRWIVEKTQAQAKGGVPIGAGNFGRVRSRQLTGSAIGDLDRDGVSDPLDIDDDGDLVLDNLDATSRGSAGVSAQASEDGGSPLAESFTAYPWLISRDPANANALPPGPESDALIEATLQGDGRVVISPGRLLEADPSISSVELDCGNPQGGEEPGLTYCTLGGSGEADTSSPGEASSVPYPACCDTDGDGFGSLFPYTIGADENGLGLLHRATSEQIATGDVLIARIEHSDGSPDEEVVTSLAYVFATAPALVSYDDGQGNSVTIDYPPPSENPEYPVEAGPGGDVVLTLTFWRPQRPSIPPEEDGWIDVGGLGHGTVADGADIADPGLCDQTTYSNLEPGFTPIQVGGYFGGDGLRDPVEDRPASPNNTFSYQVNLTECRELKGGTFGPGERRGFYFGASTARLDAEDTEDVAANSVSFKRE